MNAISNLINTTTGIALNRDGLEAQRSPATPGGEATVATERAKSATMPPEIVQLIINYLEYRDLINVVTLNWTWAQTAAPKLWQDIQFTGGANRIVFLITKSVAPAVSTMTSTSIARSDPDPIGPRSPLPPADQESTAGSGSNVQRPPAPTRRNSYPWPTLLPYHTMVHSLNVTLSSADMIQDLLEMIPCCSELRAFSIKSAIPTEDLLLRGVIASASNDVSDPLNEGLSAGPNVHTSASSASLASTASQCSASATHPCRHQHSHTHSLSLDPYNRTTYPRAGLQEADDETIMASTASQSGKLLSLLANSCPKLEKLSFSGFHPLSVLGAPTDLRPRPSKFSVKLSNDQRRRDVLKSTLETGASRDMESPFAAASASDAISENAQMPPIPPVPGMNAAAAASNPIKNTTTIPPTAETENSQAQSKIYSLQFVNCSLPPQYLLTMIQHSLPNLTEIHLTQCWQGNPLQGSFLESLTKICPGLRHITLHATQSHRGIISPVHALKMLQSLEGSREGGDGSMDDSDSVPTPSHGAVASMACFPLGTFGRSKYTTPSVSSAGATVGSSSMSKSNSNSSSSSALVNLPSSGLSSSDSNIDGAISDQSSQGQQGRFFDNASVDPDPFLSPEMPQRMASALESVSIWFTHSILDRAITAELANRVRHPKLKSVQFGSEDAFDIGEECIQTLLQQRPELEDCCWVGYGDTGEDRED